MATHNSNVVNALTCHRGIIDFTNKSWWLFYRFWISMCNPCSPNWQGRWDGAEKLSFPLDTKGVEDIKSHAERAGVGLPDRTVVNLDVRKTW